MTANAASPQAAACRMARVRVTSPAARAAAATRQPRPVPLRQPAVLSPPIARTTLLAITALTVLTAQNARLSRPTVAHAVPQVAVSKTADAQNEAP